MEEYRTAKGWKFFIYSIATALIVFSLCVLVSLFIPIGLFSDRDSAEVDWTMVVIFLGLIVLMVGLIIETISYRFVITTETIYSKSFFTGTRVLKLDEIKGYRVVDKLTHIEPIDKKKKKLKLGISYLSKSNELIDWLYNNYQDLDRIDIAQQREDILSNENFGFTIEERERKLEEASKWANILNWTGSLASAWIFFWPNPYEYATTACIIVPLVCIFFLRYFKGIIRFDEAKKAYPNISWVAIMSSLCLMLRAMLDFNIFDYTKIWPSAALIAVAMAASIITSGNEYNLRKIKTYGAGLAISLFGMAYAYGTIVSINCVYDKSLPEIYYAKILEKRVSSGKVTTYHFELTPWGPQKEVEEVNVPRPLYNTMHKGDHIKVYLYMGLFEIPWFEVTD